VFPPAFTFQYHHEQRRHHVLQPNFSSLPFSEEDDGCGDGVILSMLSSDRSRESFESSNGVEHLLVLLTVGCVGELFVEALLPPSSPGVR
jgi:hypothetical protein